MMMARIVSKAALPVKLAYTCHDGTRCSQKGSRTSLRHGTQIFRRPQRLLYQKIGSRIVPTQSSIGMGQLTAKFATCKLHGDLVACDTACFSFATIQSASLTINFLVIRVEAELPDHEPTGHDRQRPQPEVQVDATDLAHDLYT